MSSAWRNFKNIFSRPLFTIIFRPIMIKFHSYSILTVEGKDDFLIYCMLSTMSKARASRDWNQLFCFVKLDCLSAFWFVCQNFGLFARFFFSTYLFINLENIFCKIQILEIKCVAFDSTSNLFESTNIALGGRNPFHPFIAVCLF